MKLDYLQFIELEVFTRFGARLEAAMEAAIRHGRVLREILKQDRLTPLSIEFQMAWLVAYNDGLFDDTEPADIRTRLTILEKQVNRSGLTLDIPRQQWSKAVSGWLGLQPGK